MVTKVSPLLDLCIDLVEADPRDVPAMLPLIAAVLEEEHSAHPYRGRRLARVIRSCLGSPEVMQGHYTQLNAPTMEGCWAKLARHVTRLCKEIENMNISGGG